MADPIQFNILNSSIRVWNAWRKDNPNIVPDLSGVHIIDRFLQEGVGDNYEAADLSGADLKGANFTASNLQHVNFAGADLTDALMGRLLEHASFVGANLTGAYLRDSGLDGTNFSGANLTRANLIYSKCDNAPVFKRPGDEDVPVLPLNEQDCPVYDFFSGKLIDASWDHVNFSGANLAEADLTGADLSGANLIGASLVSTNLGGANLSRADFSGAILRNANLIGTNLVGATLSGAVLSGCYVYGVSAWDLDVDSVKEQISLVITPPDESVVTVDNLEVAQFVYLLLRNRKIRDVINTIGRKAILILGRFSADRKAVLDALTKRLRQADYVPIVFDWEKPTARDLTETVQLLANLSRFVIADITDARSIPQELTTIVAGLPSVPICPVILKGQQEYAMFEHWTRYPWVLPIHRYRNAIELVNEIESWLFEPIRRWENGSDIPSRMREIIREQEVEIVKLRASSASI